MAKIPDAVDGSLAELFCDGDVLPGGWIRLSVAARRLSQRLATVYGWNYQGISVGRGAAKRVFTLRVKRFGRDARTKIAWLEEFFDEPERYRQKLRTARRASRAVAGKETR